MSVEHHYGVHVLAKERDAEAEFVFDAWLPEAPVRDDYLRTETGLYRIMGRTWSDMSVLLDVRREWGNAR